MGKNKMINAATCDARAVTEESLAGYEKITINAALLIIGAHSKALLHKYPVTINAANILEVPDGENITVKSINGKGTIGPNADGTGTILMVNGQLTILNGSREAVKSYYRILVNGTVLMPQGFEGQFSSIQVNGRTEYYPDGATILKPGTEIDTLFVLRAENTFYYSPGTLFFLDAGINTEKILAARLKFAAKKIVITNSLAAKLIQAFDETSNMITVPDGTHLIAGDVELDAKIIKKYGTKLCIIGDASILNAEALSALEYLFTNGTVRIHKDLADAFDALESNYDELKIVDPELGYITNRPAIKIGLAVLQKYPKGVLIEDCARVTLSEALSTEDIIEKLHIVDCAMVVCSKEQEEAVNLIAEDVAMIRTAQPNSPDRTDMANEKMYNTFFGDLKDTQVINAAEYRM